MNKAGRNERRKLIAGWFNTVSAAFMTIGIVSPGLAFILSEPNRRPTIEVLIIVIMVCTVLSFAIHVFGQLQLTGYEE
jgi:hypothetical protein